jgi:hypothetical protein
MTPDQANGFVIWDDSDSEIKYWEVVVFERSPLTDSTFNEVRVWRHEEWRNNYVYIPKEYRPLDTLNKYGVYLYGKNSSHEIIAEEAVIPFLDCDGCDGQWWYPFIYIDCNGPDYAWRVRQYVLIGGWGHKYTLTNASFFGEPIYEYMTNTVYNAMISNMQGWFLNYYGINNPAFLIPDNPSDFPIFPNIYVKNITNSPDIEYRDKAGNVIFDNTFKAVRKAAGPWNEAVATHPWTPVFATEPSSGLYLNYDLVYAMALMNSSNVVPAVNPPLDCTGQGYTSPDGEQFDDWAVDCNYLYDDIEQFDLEDSTGIANFIQAWLECIGDDDEVQDDIDDSDFDHAVWDHVIDLTYL